MRFTGTVERLDAEASREYFARRPRGSQLGAAASDQSRVVESRIDLEKRFAELDERYADSEIPMPENWGGYVLHPDEIEFWQGRENRLHDRIRFRRGPDGEWIVERLSP